MERGQFFLMAAIVFVGALLGLTVVVNYVQKSGENERFYDLGKEIGFEARQVSDYGTYNDYEGEGQGTDDLIRRLIEDYAPYIERDRVVFVYGNSEELHAYTLTQDGVGCIGIDTGGLVTCEGVARTQVNEVPAISQTGDLVRVSIDGIDYNFNLENGQNFYFVLVREENEDRFVTTG